MKRFFSVFSLMIMAIMVMTINAQIITADDFNKIDLTEFDTNGDGKIKDDEAAIYLKDMYGIDPNNGVTRVIVLNDIPKSKNEIYVAVNEWFIHSFNNGKSVIQLNDKDEGVIIGKGFVDNMGHTMSFASNANISAYVLIRVDIKDNRMRITTTIQEYNINNNGGVMGAIGYGLGGGRKIDSNYTLLPSSVFPFTNKKKKEGAKAFYKSHIYSLVIINKLSDAVYGNITGTDNDW